MTRTKSEPMHRSLQ